MGLITQGPAFARWSDNIPFPSGNGFTNIGTPVVPGVSNAMGSPVTLLPALAHDCEYLTLSMSGFSHASGDSSSLADILIDPAGGTSWSTLISSLLVGYTGGIDYDSTGSLLGVPMSYFFPIWLPAGTSIGIQAQLAHSAAPTEPARVIAQAAGGNRNPASWWCGQKVETVGTMSPSTSRGQSHTPGAANSITGAANNGSGLIRLTTSTTGMTTGDVRAVSSVNGTVEANGIWTITVIDATHLDLQGSTFTNAYTSGGFITGDFSAWTSLGSATAARAGALQWAAQANGSSAINKTYRYEFGANSTPIGPCVWRAVNALRSATQFPAGPVFCDIPAGTQLQVRGKAGQTIPGTTDVAGYLVQ